MMFLSVDDCREYLRRAGEADEWGYTLIPRMQRDVIARLLNEIDVKEQKLQTLRNAVEKALGHVAPSSAAWDIINDALQDSE